MCDVRKVAMLLVMVVISCGREPDAITGPVHITATPEERMRSQSELCSLWILMEKQLTDDKKQMVAKFGIVLAPTGTRPFPGYFISERLVEDCDDRVRFGHLLWNVPRVEESKEDRVLMTERSADVVRLLLRVWDNPMFSSDGTVGEKYAFVNHADLAPEDNLRLVRYILAEKQLNVGLVNSILRSPSEKLLPDLIKLYEAAVESGEIDEQVCFAVMIAAAGDRKRGLSGLEAVARNTDRPLAFRRGVRGLAVKIRKKQRIEPDDLEALRLNIPDLENPLGIDD